MIYGLLIIGAGPAGLTASIYASRYKLNHLVFGEAIGGQMGEAPLVENYPGFKAIPGLDLAQKFLEQAQGYGMKAVTEGVVSLRRTGDTSNFSNSSNEEERIPLYEVTTKSGKAYQAKALILAMGAQHRHLNIPGEEKFLGRGVSYCATCDAPLFKGKTVAVVGGGDSALSAAVLLAGYAPKVYLIHRRDEYRAEPFWVERMKAKKVVEILNNEVIRVLGKDELSNKQSGDKENKVMGGVELKNEWHGNKIIVVDGLFVEVGLLPALSLVKDLGLAMLEGGYIQVDPSGKTNVPGVFGAGDLCQIPGRTVLRQIITAAAQGAWASAGVYEYLHQKSPVSSWG